MSLLSHLRDPTSPVHRFFAERFTDAGAARSALAPGDDPGVIIGRSTAGSPTPKHSVWRLGDAQVLPADQDRPGFPWATVGTAFDYRVRFYFPEREFDHRAAHTGATMLVGRWRVPLELPSAFVELEAHLSDLRAVEPARRGDDAFERDLAELCFALALYEQFFRSGGHSDDDPLYRLGPLADLGVVVSLAPASALEDLMALANRLVATQGTLLVSSATPNPSFAGSPFLGGADADLIAGGRLLDVKTTVSSTIERLELWQLLGYALCDFDDAFCIEEVGLYYSRHGVQVAWPVDELLSLMSGQATRASQVRSVFESLLRALLPLPR